MLMVATTTEAFFRTSWHVVPGMERDRTNVTRTELDDNAVATMFCGLAVELLEPDVGVGAPPPPPPLGFVVVVELATGSEEVAGVHGAPTVRS